jgi:hypothetical protein
MPQMQHEQIVSLRRKLRISGYKSLADVGFDGDWITPYQISSRSKTGPVLVALHWLDEPSIELNRDVLLELGFLPELKFNRVLDLALDELNLRRADLYVTQVFHLVPRRRSEVVPGHHLAQSFHEVTLHELRGRKVVALGGTAAQMCASHGVAHYAACHPSRRGFSYQANASDIAQGIALAMQ